MPHRATAPTSSPKGEQYGSPNSKAQGEPGYSPPGLFLFAYRCKNCFVMDDKLIWAHVRTLLIIAGAVVALVIATATLQGNSIPWVTSAWQHLTNSSPKTSVPTGVIYFSGKVNKPGYLPTLLALNLTTGKVNTLGQDVQNEVTNAEYLSPGQHKAVYSAASLIQQNGKMYLPSVTQLTVLDATTRTMSTLTHSATYKTTPVFSPDGQEIAFAAKDLTEATGTSAHPWNIMVTDLSGNERLITSGQHPQWESNGINLLVLKSDGVYEVGKDTLQATKLPGLGDISSFKGASMTLSKDGTMLAIAAPADSKTYVYDMPRLGNSAPNLHYIFSGDTSWPVFSDDEQYLAVYAQVASSTGDVSQEVAIFSLATGQLVTTYDLSAYTPTSIALTDWRHL